MYQKINASGKNAFISTNKTIKRIIIYFSRSHEEVKIYNYVSSCEKPITWLEYNNINYLYYKTYPFSKLIWKPVTLLTKNIYLHIIYKVVFHYLPALFMDICLMMMLKRPRIFNEFRKIHKLMGVIEYFSTNDFIFTDDNVKKTWSKMNSTDRNLFPMNMGNICWMDYFKNYTKGICMYLLKDDNSKLEESKRRARRFELLHICCKYLFVVIAFNFVWSIITSCLNWLIKV